MVVTSDPLHPFFFLQLVLRHKHFTESHTMSTLWWREAYVCTVLQRFVSPSHIFLLLRLSLSFLLFCSCRREACCSSEGYIYRFMVLELTSLAEIVQTGNVSETTLRICSKMPIILELYVAIFSQWTFLLPPLFSHPPLFLRIYVHIKVVDNELFLSSPLSFCLLPLSINVHIKSHGHTCSLWPPSLSPSICLSLLKMTQK